MMLDPEISELLPALNSAFPRVETMTGPQARAAIRARLQIPAEPEPVADVADRAVPGVNGDIGVRIYWPRDESVDRPPVVIFAHGGGFVFCDLDTHDGICRSMANGVGAVVVSVDYRLAPEAPWPAAAEDMYAATAWVAENAKLLGADPTRLIVAGDSAGGNLAAVTAVLAKDRRGPEITGQLLLYPVIAPDFTTASYREFGNDFYNTREAMQWYWDQYVPAPADRTHPYAAPLGADLTGLPPAIVVTAGCDPLHSEGETYANSLSLAGVPTMYRSYAGAIHGFMTMSSLRLARQARKQAWADVTNLLASPAVSR
ncbi:alpha/beta hydrolase [Aldersonia kunmingensis]|uniref:alpha/beta hydrolase n=1 Tax=Aldersonia kunmingensis TaxID=408066 RepID=UPI00082CCE29|nr:alpha/beta hydrolase [Aldersonia kunmingensis]